MNFMSAIQIEGTVGAFCWERASENIHIDKNNCDLLFILKGMRASSTLLNYGNILRILCSKRFLSSYWMFILHDSVVKASHCSKLSLQCVECLFWISLLQSFLITASCILSLEEQCWRKSKQTRMLKREYAQVHKLFSVILRPKREYLFRRCHLVWLLCQREV